MRLNSLHADLPREARWPYAHTERVGPRRTLRLQTNGPWLFETAAALRAGRRGDSAEGAEVD